MRKYLPILLNDNGVPDEFVGGNVNHISALAVIVPNSTPAQLLANTNDYDPGVAIYSSFRLSSNAAYNITGFLAAIDGQMMFLKNVGGFNLSLTNQDVLSVAANRIITGTGAALVLAPDGHAILQYDSTTARWRVIG